MLVKEDGQRISGGRVSGIARIDLSPDLGLGAKGRILARDHFSLESESDHVH